MAEKSAANALSINQFGFHMGVLAIEYQCILFTLGSATELVW